MRFAVYDPATGDILRVVICPPQHAAIQAGRGEAVIEVGPEVGDATHRIVGGAAVLIE